MKLQYQDRKDAGQVLAGELTNYKNHPDTLVLALPRGGVPVAYEVAIRLHLPLDVFLVRKLGVPGHEELAMGAIGEANTCFINESLVTELGIHEREIEAVIETEQKELKRRLQHYRQGRALPSLERKTVILVDDGIATGATLKAAITALSQLKPKKVIVAVPVAGKESIAELKALGVSVVCPRIPDFFYGVGNWYESFPQTSDAEVLNLLANAKSYPLEK